MRILVLGASGYVGGAIYRELAKSFREVYGTYRRGGAPFAGDGAMLRFDVEKDGAADRLLGELSPDVIVSSLRGDYERQAAVHGKLAEFLKGKPDGKLLYLSSLNAFDHPSQLDRPHFERENPRAGSEYGNHKIQCEQIVRRTLGDNGVILRIPPVYGRNGPRVKALQSAARAGQPVRVSTPHELNFTTDKQVAQWVSYIIEHGLKGTFHIGTRDTRDYYAFQRDLAKALGLGNLVFQVERQEEPVVQAVLSEREDIPETLYRTVDEVIALSSGRRAQRQEKESL